MRNFRGWYMLGLSGLWLVGWPIHVATHTQSQEPKPAPISVKLAAFEAMEKIVQGFKGKVVVVDFWSTT